jgi:hypothetical protein
VIDDIGAGALGQIFSARVDLAHAMPVDVLDHPAEDLGLFEDLPTSVQAEARSRFADQHNERRSG